MNQETLARLYRIQTQIENAEAALYHLDTDSSDTNYHLTQAYLSLKASIASMQQAQRAYQKLQD